MNRKSHSPTLFPRLGDLFWDLRSPGILRSVEWWFRTNVSGQPICPISKGQEIQEEFEFWILNAKMILKRTEITLVFGRFVKNK
jgi:hypothetical protein